MEYAYDTFLAKCRQNIDWNLIRQRLLRKGFKSEECSMAIALYCGFIFLGYLHPCKRLVPNQLIDAVLHEHIETQRYQKDLKFLGVEYHVHRNEFGTRSEADYQDWLTAFEQTKNLFLVSCGKSLGNSAPAQCEWLPASA